MRLILALILLLILVVPGASAQDETYTVQYGDVLDLIAAAFDVAADCIAEASGLDNPNQLRPGDVLVIPDDCPPYDGQAIVPNSVVPADEESAGQGGGGSAAREGDYVVEQGDVLDVIAAAFDASVSCIAEASGLEDANRIFPGDVLTIPADCPPYDGVAFVPVANDAEAGQGGGGGAASARGDTYTVRFGDVLDLIGARFNVSAFCLAEVNGLENPGRIYPGDEIIIDASCPPYDGLATAADIPDRPADDSDE